MEVKIKGMVIKVSMNQVQDMDKTCIHLVMIFHKMFPWTKIIRDGDVEER
jgi:hypothetical protein